MVTRIVRCRLVPCIVVFLATVAASAAAAQQADRAKIVAIQLSVRHRVGPTGNFVKSTVGALLPPGSRVQTGARSKCAVQFPNGGVIRMDERSDLVIQSASGTSMQLNGGRLWAKVIAGTTARVQGSRGVAVVKGTEWTFDGQSVTCYDGESPSRRMPALLTSRAASRDERTRTAPSRSAPCRRDSIPVVI